MALIRHLFLLAIFIVISTLYLSAQVLSSEITDDACQNEIKSISPITISEQAINDFNLTTAVGETLIFQPTSGILTPGVGTVSFTTGDVNAQITVTSSLVTVTLNAATGNHTSSLDMLTISGLQITASIQENIELRYISGTASVNGLAANAPVAYIDFHLIPIGVNDNLTICGDQSVGYDLQINLNNLGNGVTSNFSWAAVENPNVSGEGADGSTDIYDFLSNVTAGAEIVTYNVIPTSVPGCIGAPFQINVTVNPRIQLAGFTKSSTTLDECVNNIVTYTTDPGYTTYSWSITNEASIVSGGSSTDNFVIVEWPASPTTGLVSITNVNSFGCATQPFGFPVEVRDNGPTASNTVATAVCSETPIAFDIQAYTATTHLYTFTAADNIATTGESSGTNFISDNISNPSSSVQNVAYTVVGVHNDSGCQGSPFIVTVPVNPVPIGASQLTAICSGIALNENPQNLVDAVGGNGVIANNFTWTSLPDPEVTGTAFSGNGTITELLTNQTADLHGIVYTINGITAAGCIGPAFALTVHVNPPPKIFGPTSICTGSDVIFFATNPSGLFSWSAPGASTVSGGASGDSFFEVNWASGTEVSVSVNYTNSYGCSGLANLAANLTTLIPDAPSNGNATRCSSVPIGFNLQSLIVPPVPSSFSWVAADNGNTSGERLTPAPGDQIIDQVVNTTSGAEVVIYTVTPTGACGTGTPFTVNITVNPEPVGTLGNSATCSGAAINFNLATSITNGVPSSFSWIAADNPHTMNESDQYATNTSVITDSPTLTEQYTSEIVAYTVTPISSFGCIGVNYGVNATIQGAPAAPARSVSICSGMNANVDLQAHLNSNGNAVPSTFSWIAADAPNVTGESLVAQNGGTINNFLSVSGVPKQTVTYNVTATSLLASCTGAIFTALVEVNNTPQAPNSTQTLCSGIAQNFDINTYYFAAPGAIPGTTFSWLAADNPNVTGETHPLQTTTSIADVVVNPTASSQNVVYTITASAPNGCLGMFTRTVTMDPLPTTSVINNRPVISSTGTTDISLSSNVIGATFSYTVSAPPEISGASPGAGSTIAQALTNANTLQHIVTYTITASANGCSGLAAIASLTVRGDPTMNQNDSLALVSLYNALGGPTWTTRTNWMSGPANTWVGVNVSSERLTSLALPANNLTGSLPVAFFNAPLLNLLDLRNNNITGALPPEISNLSALQLLNLQNNQMDGALPNGLFSLSNLTQLFLRGNNFTGSISPLVGNLTNLQTLQAEGLPMTGPIPAEVFGLTSLINLGLSGKINGPLPAAISSLTSLVTFSCDSCAITSVPAGMTSLVNLTSLRLHNNRIESLPNLSSLPLNNLDVSKNSLTFESLEPHTSVATFLYIPQDTVGVAKSILIQTTTPHTFTSNVGGSANQYMWRKNNVVIPTATSANYTITSPVFDDEGTYHAEVTSSLLPGLTIKTSPVNAKVSSLKRDSLTLLQIYNTTNGTSWTGVSGWPTGTLNTWSGVVIASNRVTGLDLSNKGLTGELPAEFTDLRSLLTANLSGNKLTGIPVVSSMTSLTNLNVSSNNISFGTLEPNASVLGKLTYSPQNVIGVVSRDSIQAGTPVEFSVNATGQNNLYQWKRNNNNVNGATANTYAITGIGRQTMGDYICEITNSLVPNLVLRTAVKTVLATADLSGRVKVSATNPATKGRVTLLRVNPDGAFVKTKTNSIVGDGNYSFTKIVLDDYQIVAFADTVQHIGALPTYYKNTLLWEEADTIFLNVNKADLDIVTIFKPSPASGRGQISGLVQEEEEAGSGGRTKLPKPVKQVGVSARRVQNTGRGQEEVLTLIAYVFTNENGEFSLGNLPTGNYRLNIQYPGYPMDEKSFITFTIGTGLEQEVKVEALVDKGVINVRQLIITGVWSKENYAAEVFPNPTSSTINIRFGTTSSYRDIGIFDITGKQIQKIRAFEEKAEIDVTSFAKGIYLIKVNDKGSMVKSLHVIIE